MSKLVVHYLFSKHASEFWSTVYKVGHWTLCSAQVAVSKLAFGPFFRAVHRTPPQGSQLKDFEIVGFSQTTQILEFLLSRGSESGISGI